MKPVANLYSVSLTDVSPRSSVTSMWQNVTAFVSTIPHYVWLGMIVLAAFLVATSVMLRTRDHVQAAQGAHAMTQTQLVAAQSENALLKERTTQLRTNVRAVAQIAQAQLHQVRPNEIVIATK